MLVFRFWLSVTVFHVGMLLLSAGILRRWLRSREVVTLAGWGLALVGEALAFGFTAIGLGAAAVWLGGGGGFTFLRLMCQALFGEAVLLTLVAAFLQLHHHRRAGRAAVLALALLFLLSVYVEAYHREPHDLQVRFHSVDVSVGKPAVGRLRILHLTDIQTPEIGPYEERALREGLAQRPDLIVFTGDYIHERLAHTASKAAADFRALLQRSGFAAPLGVYATEGDSGLDCGPTFRGTVVECLVNESRRIALPGGGAAAVVGLSARLSRGRDPERLAAVLNAAPSAAIRIVVGHRPDYVLALPGRAHADLALAGHTHGGQVVIPFVGPPLTLSRLPRRYAGDVHDYAGIRLHVSRGVGMERGTAPQIRFLCPPEICVLDVRY